MSSVGDERRSVKRRRQRDGSPVRRGPLKCVLDPLPLWPMPAHQAVGAFARLTDTLEPSIDALEAPRSTQHFVHPTSDSGSGTNFHATLCIAAPQSMFRRLQTRGTETCSLLLGAEPRLRFDPG